MVRSEVQPMSGTRPALVVSACLLGVRCNHEGEANTSELVVALGDRFRLVPVCPEGAGGLPTPRPAAELQTDGRVINIHGDDVTDSFERGAAFAVTLADEVGARTAVLKARSPSCGKGRVYDGSFSRTLTDGDGLAAAALRAAGVTVLDEDDIANGVGPRDVP